MFRQMLDLSCHNPATAVIAGNVIADNHVQIFVNGIARSVILGPYDAVNSFSVSGSGGGVFIAGWNVVDFVVTNTAGSVGNLSGMRVEVTSATATVNASASGAKFAVTRTPAGGNFTQGSTVTVSSGSENVTWSLEGSPGGTLTPNGNSATYTAPTPLTGTLVATIKATNGSGVVAYQPLWFNPGSGAGACSSASSTLTFRSTGFNGALLAEGSVDPNWKMVSNPSNYGGSSGTDAIVTSSLTGGGTANAKYVNPVVGAGHVPEGFYVFRQMLDLSCHNPATAVIAGNVIADNHVQIFVNGIARSVILGPYDAVNSFSVSGSGGGVFIAGWNVMDFVVTNTTGSVGNLSGMRVEVTSATATVNASASGAKFAVTRTPAGGNFTQGSTVTVSSGSEIVTWSLEGSPGGTLTPNGNSATYTAPTPLTVMLVATIKATNGSGVVAYQPLWFNPGSGSGSVAISPTTPGNLAPYQTLSFSATVTGGTTNNVKWRVLSKTAVIPLTTGTSVTISAITPDATSVAVSQQFAATVSNADNSAVQWSVSPVGAHSISADGIYTASTFTGTATVTARSAENTNVSATPETFSVTGGGLNSSLQSMLVASSMFEGQSFAATVNMNNTGGVAWDTTSGAGTNRVILASQTPSNNLLWGTNVGYSATANVAPLASAAFTINGRAPVGVTGAQVFDWQLRRGSSEWFGVVAKPTPATINVVAGSTAAQVVIVSAPPTVNAGASFNVSIRMKNTGTATWWSSAVSGTTPFKLLKSNAESWGISEAALPQSYVDPNGEVTFTLTLTAPTVPGQKTLAWRMGKGSTAFGDATSTSIGVLSVNPAVFDIAPVNGNGAETTFSGKFSGGQYLPATARLLFYGTSTSQPNCYIEYNKSTNQVRLGVWGGAAEPPVTMPSAAFIENANCYVKLQESSVSGGTAVEGNTLNLSFRLGFKLPMASNTWNMHGFVENTNWQHTGWVFQGTWAVPAVVNVTINPPSAAVVSGQSQVFSSTVTGTANTAVNWMSLGWGTVTNTSPNTTFTAGTVTYSETTNVKATSVADSSKSALASITVQPTGSVVSITNMWPVNNSGRLQSFTIDANGGNAPIQTMQFYANLSAPSSGGCLITVNPQSGYVTVGSNGGGSMGGTLGSGVYLQWTNCGVYTGSSNATFSGNTATANLYVNFYNWSHYGSISLYGKASNTAGSTMLDWYYGGSWFLN